MAVTNYFYLSTSAIAPLRQRIVFLHDGGFIADPLYHDMIHYLDEISESISFYSRAVKKGLGEL